MAFWNKNKNKKDEIKEIETKKEKVNEKEIEMKKDPSKESFAKPQGRNIYYVSARKDKNGKKIGWEVKKENATKVTRIVDTKDEAIEIVKELAGNNESTVIIRKMDGSIQETMKFKNKESK